MDNSNHTGYPPPLAPWGAVVIAIAALMLFACYCIWQALRH